MEKHWLVRPKTIRLLRRVFVSVLAFTLLLELVIQHEAHFRVERLFGFSALFGFVACAALILIAKAIGILLKRADNYYDEEPGG